MNTGPPPEYTSRTFAEHDLEHSLDCVLGYDVEDGCHAAQCW